MKGITVGKVVVLFIGMMFLSGCGLKQRGENVQTAEIPLTCIAVLAVMYDLEDDGKLTGADKKSLEDGVLVLERLLKKQLVNVSDVRFVRQDQFPIPAHDGGAGFLSMLREAGLQTGCNGVLVMTLHRYRDRVGGSYAVEEPASVSFSWRLLEVNSGIVLCHGRYDETQKSVLENLYYFSRAIKRGFTWVTAESLLADGLDRQFGKCSYLRSDR